MSEETIRTLIETIDSFMTSNLPDTLYELVLRRLELLGYTATETDALAIAFSVQKAEFNIKNECNISEIPEELHHTLCDMSCGDFLAVKYHTGQLNLAELDLEGAISSISEGNVSITFDKSTTDEGKFNALVSALSTFGRGNVACYRRFKW